MRTGRQSVPPLAYWANERIDRAADGGYVDGSAVARPGAHGDLTATHKTDLSRGQVT